MSRHDSSSSYLRANTSCGDGCPVGIWGSELGSHLDKLQLINKRSQNYVTLNNKKRIMSTVQMVTPLIRRTN